MEQKRVILKDLKFYDNGNFYRTNVLIEEDKAVLTRESFQDAEEIDLSYCTLLPGMIDTHCHPFELGQAKKTLDLRGITSIESLRLKLMSYKLRKKHGEWLLGRGWDHEIFREKRFPTRYDIDDITTENPVFLKRICGHVALLNSTAIEKLKLGNISNEFIEKDSQGRLSGIIKESALDMVSKIIKISSRESCLDDFVEAENEAFKAGIAELNCILSPENYREELEAIKYLKETGNLGIKLRIYLPINALNDKEVFSSFKNDDMARINGFKIFADGSLGARTAALREPYSDDKSNSGILRYSDREMKEIVQMVDSLEMQAIIHAIGDRAIEQAVDAISSLGKKESSKHRIEHASLTPKDLINEISDKGIRLSVQPHFVVSDTWAKERLGERINDLYRFRTFLHEGIITSAGSDAPVEPINPMLGIWAAVERSHLPKEERITVNEAIDMYTRFGAVNSLDQLDHSFEDFVIYDTDFEQAHHSIIRQAKPILLVVSGRVVFSSFLFRG